MLHPSDIPDVGPAWFSALFYGFISLYLEMVYAVGAVVDFVYGLFVPDLEEP